MQRYSASRRIATLFASRRLATAILIFGIAAYGAVFVMSLILPETLGRGLN